MNFEQKNIAEPLDMGWKQITVDDIPKLMSGTRSYTKPGHHIRSACVLHIHEYVTGGKKIILFDISARRSFKVRV